jgi:diguanylate cyclase (GGDEF)-like protein
MDRQNTHVIRDLDKIFDPRYRFLSEIILASIQDGVIITNATAQVVYVNHIIEKYLHIKLINAYFKPIEELIPDFKLLAEIRDEHVKLQDVKICLNNKIYFFDVQITRLLDDKKLYLGMAIFVHDLTQMKQDQARINYLAYHDDSTGLPNKFSLIEYYKKIISNTNLFLSIQDKLFTVVIHIPNLKNINDTIGYAHGDETLDKLLRIIKNYLNQCDFSNSLYRIGSDVLAVTLVYDEAQNGKSSMLYITNFLNNFIVELNKPISINEQNIYLQFHFGISVFPDNFKLEYNQSEWDLALLLRYAKIAMREARKKGLNKYVFFSKDINTSIQEGFTLENELRAAIRENKLELLFQPQIELKTNKLRGFEILVRWQRENGDKVLPGTFIPLLEQSGLIVTVGDWILREACLQGVILIKKGIKFQKLAVNISGLQLQTEYFVERLKNILMETNFPKNKLELEITESILLDNADKIIAILNKIRLEGICIALDDFGTGFSSLNYLKDLPLDYIKIDRVFVHSINSGDTRLLEAILAIAKTMDLISIAEGVETESQVLFLREHLCDIIQGYYISKPMTMEKVLITFK